MPLSLRWIYAPKTIDYLMIDKIAPLLLLKISDAMGILDLSLYGIEVRHDAVRMVCPLSVIKLWMMNET